MTPARALRSLRPVLCGLVTFAALALWLASGSAVLAQDQAQPQPNPGRNRVSPPQPQQKQGIDYFVGTWEFSWSGRETSLTAGPRSGKATYTKGTAANTLNAVFDGKVEEGAAYKETATLTWNEATKEMTIAERLASGAELRGVASWSSPIGFGFEPAPLQIKGETLKIKRTYSILSATSFGILEEVSTNGGPFQRIGTASFRKLP